jgi:hypothetical protein
MFLVFSFQYVKEHESFLANAWKDKVMNTGIEPMPFASPRPSPKGEGEKMKRLLP